MHQLSMRRGMCQRIAFSHLRTVFLAGVNRSEWRNS
jgi:hypothetical protein